MSTPAPSTAAPSPAAPSTAAPLQNPRPSSTSAVVSLIFGLLAWLLLPIIGAIIAVVSGHLARAEIRAAQGRLDGDGLAIAGLVLGYLQLVFALLVIAAIFLFFGGLAFLLAMAH